MAKKAELRSFVVERKALPKLLTIENCRSKPAFSVNFILQFKEIPIFQDVFSFKSMNGMESHLGFNITNPSSVTDQSA